jgi:NADPH:quinone reductase-like Zn-dependent oxidoreductase
VGERISAFAVGDDVFGLSSDKGGAHAEYVCVRESGPVARKPTTVAHEQAAASCDGR